MGRETGNTLHGEETRNSLHGERDWEFASWGERLGICFMGRDWEFASWRRD